MIFFFKKNLKKKKILKKFEKMKNLKNFRKNENFEILEEKKNEKLSDNIFFKFRFLVSVPYKEFHIESLANGNLSWHIFG